MTSRLVIGYISEIWRENRVTGTRGCRQYLGDGADLPKYFGTLDVPKSITTRLDFSWHRESGGGENYMPTSSGLSRFDLSVK
jgi:hypothetical protein